MRWTLGTNHMRFRENGCHLLSRSSSAVETIWGWNAWLKGILIKMCREAFASSFSSTKFGFVGASTPNLLQVLLPHHSLSRALQSTSVYFPSQGQADGSVREQRVSIYRIIYERQHLALWLCQPLLLLCFFGLPGSCRIYVEQMSCWIHLASGSKSGLNIYICIYIVFEYLSLTIQHWSCKNVLDYHNSSTI